MDAEFVRKGFYQSSLQLPEQVGLWVQTCHWSAIDQWATEQLKPSGLLHSRLILFADFQKTEHLISLRDGSDEMGIWHDDGSRCLAFSLSLHAKASEIQGGELEIRKKGTQQSIRLNAGDRGRLLIFQTGQAGFEHRVHNVRQGQRLVVAGWCSEITK